MKKLLFFMLLMCSANALAQDVIVKKDGTTILSKVLEVGTSEVKYKKYSNQNGPVYSIPISGLFTINYANGEKEDFNNTSAKNNSGDGTASESASLNSSQGLIKKPAVGNNSDVIELHNLIHPNFSGKSASEKPVRDCIIKLGVSSSSIMSNEDAEISFVRKVATGYYRDELCYFINIKNKTDRVLYVDRGNCFKVYNDGYAYCYYDASTQTTVNQGGGSGGSVNLGSVAGALGIGGIVGQVAGGVNVGGGTSSSISTSYAKQRIISIPPHGSKYLSEDVWIGTGKRRTRVESPESFYFGWGCSEHDRKGTDYNSITDLGLRRGVIGKRQTKVFAEKELPWKREFYITYSTDDNFRTYSVLNANLYIQEIIGEPDVLYSDEFLKMHKKQKWYLNENTIVAYCQLDKK